MTSSFYEDINTNLEKAMLKDTERSSSPLDKKSPSFEHIDHDLESNVEVKTSEDDKGLKRQLKPRHMRMIAIGGCVGTGLFVGSGNALADGGPASIIIAFTVIGLYVLFTTSALAELSVLYPVSGSFYTYFSRFIDPAWGFAVGIQYWLSFAVTVPLELTVAPLIINVWHAPGRASVWITVFYVLIIGINIWGTKGYGEVEFVLSIVKLIAVFGFLLLSIIIAAGGVPTDTRGVIGVSYWKPPLTFNNGIKGFCAVLVIAIFSLSGTELVGLAAAEAKDPHKTIPKAVRQIFWRIILFYVLALFMLTLVIPSNNPHLRTSGDSEALLSPFVIAIRLANIKALPSVMNAVILSSTLSVGNSASYAASRALFALAKNGFAPKFLLKTNKRGHPVYAIIITLSLGSIAYFTEAGIGGALFGWLLSICGLSTTFIWGSICLSHIQFRRAWKAQNHSLIELPYLSMFGIYGSIYGVVMTFIALAAQLYVAIFPIDRAPNPISFFQAYLAAPLLVISYTSWKLLKKTSIVNVNEINLEEGMQVEPNVEQRIEEKPLDEDILPMVPSKMDSEKSSQFSIWQDKDATTIVTPEPIWPNKS
ncbi:amino acid transmembrane transporter Meu22 [Schizosaccharomyces osmophilus]|uniref:Amino acid transmembrane transporter Meu22 n=1 Tax=Schizosaccharomyces osmophilus TaxID=2545709 RepID=A0AAF0AVD0_9SCHI|nr:amino acid transmembrane transporter Meu22 [Schizosaccharomyces osmophilus]WBW71824.1 amino acid transmembrane transporter Meu22 [Schizosaccharomyces osmophilus]